MGLIEKSDELTLPISKYTKAVGYRPIVFGMEYS